MKKNRIDESPTEDRDENPICITGENAKSDEQQHADPKTSDAGEISSPSFVGFDEEGRQGLVFVAVCTSGECNKYDEKDTNFLELWSCSNFHSTSVVR